MRGTVFKVKLFLQVPDQIDTFESILSEFDLNEIPYNSLYDSLL